MNSRDTLNGNDTVNLKRRIRFTAFIICLILMVLLIRLVYLQVIMGDELRQRSENNSIRLRNIPAVRGLIMDNRGNVLVENKPSFDLTFVPNKAATIKQATDNLKRLYNERSIPFTADLSRLQGGNFFVPIKLERAISREKLAVLKTNSHTLPGLFVEVVPVRNYLYGEVMAHILGYMGEISREELARDVSGKYRPGDFVGKSGLEKTLDDLIRGVNGAEQVEVNAVGKEVKVLGRIEPRPGYNVMLTIDLVLQKAAWEALAGRTGAVVALDPRDGSVLAMVSAPSFDPNLFSEGISRQNWGKLISNHRRPMKNRAIAGQYPPASTYKLVVAAAALEENLIDADTSFHCRGKFELGNRVFHCWRREGHGRVNLHRAMVESCDVYFYHLGKLLGVDNIAKYAYKFGFGKMTGIELSQEKKGLIPTKRWKMERYKEPWYLGETLSVAIGQSFNLVTPLQLVSAYSAIANGGNIYRPRIVKKLLHQDGQVYREYPPVKLNTLQISENTRELLKRALWGGVNDDGATGAALRRPERDVGGKTGTAQSVGFSPDGKPRRFMRGSSYKVKNHALFVGYAPDKKPEIAIAVILEHAGAGGGAVAAPVARKVIDAFFAQKLVSEAK